MKNVLIKAFQMKKIYISLSFLLLIFLIGCDYFEQSDTLNISQVEVNISGLPALPDSMTYVAWIDNENTKISAKLLFYSDGDNGSLSYKSEVPTQRIQEAQLFRLTIEREVAVNDSGFKPSSRLVLFGRFAQGGCNFAVGENIFGFENTSVVVNLLTPTDILTNNELNGVWFVDSLQSTPQKGLSLPALYGGWIYEGWVEKNGQMISTGRFSKMTGVDMQNIYGGTGGAPLAYPGEDFLANPPAGFTFPLDLTGAKVLVSLELNDGKKAGTTPNKIIYESTIPSPAQTKVSYSLVNKNAVVPSGSATLIVDVLE